MKPKVFLTGGDNLGWALDEDLRLSRLSIEGIVEFADLRKCDIVHSVWWEGILSIPRGDLTGKRIICHMPGEPFRYMGIPNHQIAMQVVGQWITQSSKATTQLKSVGIKSIEIPYVVDMDTFYPMKADDVKIREIHQQWNIPEGTYLIGSFQRDTEGGDLRSPKLMKGPDIFVEIVNGLWRKGFPVHVILTGPRRFWLRKRLKDLGIPFTFIGQNVNYDDMNINKQPHSLVNILYNLIDLYIVSSRSEGGPRAILEAAATRCKIISTDVGMARDVLSPGCIYDSAVCATKLIEEDIHNNALADNLDTHYERVNARHRREFVVPLFQKLYKSIESVPVYQDITNRTKSDLVKISRKPSGFSALLKQLRNCRAGRRLTVAIWHKFMRPPWGGGNQFMLILKKSLERRGVRVLVNEIDHSVNAYLLQAVWLDVERFRREMTTTKARIIHRIDGPIYLIRGGDKDLDNLCFDLNNEFAYSTVVQSAWNLKIITSSGYRPINPVIINNSVDPEIFNGIDRSTFSPKRKVRLISTSWSDNPRKGGGVYKWIENNLDWDRFDYTFVGKASESFQRIKTILPVSSEKLANILRQHDIYITASQNDPCSNALIEALACGLPTLYLNNGGHPELVGYGGLPFNNVEEILPQLDLLVENYEMFQRLIVVPSIDHVTDKYICLFKGDY